MTPDTWIAVASCVSAVAAVCSLLWSIRIHQEVKTPHGTTLAREIEHMKEQS